MWEFAAYIKIFLVFFWTVGSTKERNVKTSLVLKEQYLKILVENIKNFAEMINRR